jgi:hypothetical protein
MRWLPMKPAAPVTKHFWLIFEGGMKAAAAGFVDAVSF